MNVSLTSLHVQRKKDTRAVAQEGETEQSDKTPRPHTLHFSVVYLSC